MSCHLHVNYVLSPGQTRVVFGVSPNISCSFFALLRKTSAFIGLSTARRMFIRGLIFSKAFKAFQRDSKHFKGFVFLFFIHHIHSPASGLLLEIQIPDKIRALPP
jgi:hypothetical protein